MDNRAKVITIDDKEFQLRKMNAIKQFHLTRKIAGCFAGAMGSKNKSDQVSALLDYLADLSDARAEELLFLALGNVYIKLPNGGGWAPLVTNNQMMYDDIDLITLGKVIWEVIKFNLGNFTQLQELADKATTTVTKVNLKG